MSNIFISYNRQSEKIARTLVDDIEALGHTAWFDQELSGGQAWWDKILATVRDCDVFVFALNPEALNSTACKREYSYAADLGKPILPVLVAEGVSTNLLPPALSQIQFVDYRKTDREAALRLARALNNIPPPEPLPDPLPPAPEVPISYLGSLTEQIEKTTTLSYEEQSTLLVDLKRSYRDPETTDDARTLLGNLRKRHDLFATIAEEIDELLVGARVVALAHPQASQLEPPSAQRLQGMEPPPAGEGKLPDRHGSQRSAPHNTTPEFVQKTAMQVRVKGALILATAGVVAAILSAASFTIRFGNFADFWMLDYWRYFVFDELYIFTFVVGGAIAGAICGMDRRGIVAALVGMGIALFYVGLLDYPGTSTAMLFELLASPLGAVIGINAQRWKGLR